jgi:hypothetical protein
VRKGGLIMDKEISDVMIVEFLQKSFQVNGLEGTEDVIRRVYNQHPEILERFISMYLTMVWGKK